MENTREQQLLDIIFTKEQQEQLLKAMKAGVEYEKIKNAANPYYEIEKMKYLLTGFNYEFEEHDQNARQKANHFEYMSKRILEDERYTWKEKDVLLNALKYGIDVGTLDWPRYDITQMEMFIYHTKRGENLRANLILGEVDEGRAYNIRNQDNLIELEFNFLKEKYPDRNIMDSDLPYKIVLSNPWANEKIFEMIEEKYPEMTKAGMMKVKEECEKNPEVMDARFDKYGWKSIMDENIREEEISKSDREW